MKTVLQFNIQAAKAISLQMPGDFRILHAEPHPTRAKEIILLAECTLGADGKPAQPVVTCRFDVYAPTEAIPLTSRYVRSVLAGSNVYVVYLR